MKYVALNGLNNEYYEGTLTEIHDSMDGDEVDPDDYVFYELDKRVNVVYEKKLVLVPTGVKKQ